jgi:tetratricopeptide (TPR) repeat protein
MKTSRRDVLIACGLLALTLAASAPALHNGFVNFDDDLYVTANRRVLAGPGGEGLRWAWTTLHAGYYQPLTWTSLQLDAWLFGPAPWGFHLTNVVLHAANVLLVFGALRRLTGAAWRSAAVAALFAVHPLHVESVAWVAERKDVLSTFFGLGCLWLYAAYAERPGVVRYVAVAAALALGLLAKPMLVTLPVLLLLLDWWPLRRGELWNPRLLPEKLPLCALALAAGAVTVFAQYRGGALVPLERLPPGVRLGTAAVGCTWYLAETLWPAGLAPFYPHPGASLAWWQVAGAVALLVVISGGLVALARKRPYLLVGWLWFLVALAPVLGLVQAGEQPWADRFSYFPHVGLFILLVWGAGDLLALRPLPAAVPALGAAAVCLALFVRTADQVRYWRDSVTLLGHTLEVHPDNPVAHYTLGAALLQEGRPGEALGHFEEAVRLDPRNPRAQYNLGVGLAAVGRTDEAVERYEETLRLDPSFALAHYNLGVALVARGRRAEAIGHFTAAVQQDPELTPAHFNLAVALAEEGDEEGARAHFHTVLRLDPTFTPSPHSRLGLLSARAGRPGEAADQFREALRLAPDDAAAWHQLGRALARQERWVEAEDAFRQAVRRQPDVVSGHVALARVLEREGRAGETEYREATRLDAGWPQAAGRKAWPLATHPDARQRDGPLAVELAEGACAATKHRDAELLDVLAAAYAETGEFDRAAAAAREALAAAAPESALAGAAAERLKLYEGRQPFRSPPPEPSP